MAFYFIPRYLIYAYEQRINQLQFSLIVVIQGADMAKLFSPIYSRNCPRFRDAI